MAVVVGEMAVVVGGDDGGVGGYGIGGLLCYLANEVLALKFVIFVVDPIPVLLFGAILIGLQILVSYCICRSIEKTSLIENLRTE